MSPPDSNILLYRALRGHLFDFTVLHDLCPPTPSLSWRVVKSCHKKRMIFATIEDTEIFVLCLSKCLNIDELIIHSLLEQKKQYFSAFYDEPEVEEHVLEGLKSEQPFSDATLTFLTGISTEVYRSKINSLFSALNVECNKKRKTGLIRWLRKNKGSMYVFPPELLFNGNPLGFPEPHLKLEKKNLTKNWSTGNDPSIIARRFARWRDLGLTKTDLSGVQSTHVYTCLPFIKKTWMVDVNALFYAACNGFRIPVLDQEGKQFINSSCYDEKDVINLADGKRILLLDILSSFTVARTFLYTYAFNSGYFPDDDDVDRFIETWLNYKTK